VSEAVNPNWLALYETHAGLVEGIVFGRFNRWRRLREDLLQEGRYWLLVAARDFPEDAPPVAFPRYAWKRVRNELWRYVFEGAAIRVPLSTALAAKRKGEEIDRPQAVAVPSFDLVAAPASDSESEREPTLYRLTDAMSALSPRQREAIERIVLNGETPSSVALDWGATRKAVDQYRRRGLEALREILESKPPRLAAGA